VQLTFDSVSDLEGALRRAAAAHGEYEKETGREDPDWPVWYAAYMGRERAERQAGQGAGG
jgi:hypothetical protein